MQHRAVIESIKHGLLVLTGGPGTGKTTTINTMIRFFESEGMSILLRLQVMRRRPSTVFWR